MAQARYQYGTNPRKLEPYRTNTKKATKNNLRVVKDVPRQEVKVSVEQRKKQIKVTLFIAAVFLTLLTISYRNSKINEEFSQVQNLKKELSSIQKENEQLKVSIENGQNANNIETEAKEQLGMQKLTSKQTVYVSLPKTDYIETPTETVKIEEDSNWFQKIINKIFNKE